MQGDGIFMWYWGATAAPEIWHGAFSSVREASEQAWGHHPNGDYLLVEADRTAIDARVFSARAILDRLEDINPDCWAGGVPAASDAEKADLEAKLADCLDRWLRKHKYDTTTALHSIRSQEYFPDRRSGAHGARHIAQVLK